MVTLDAVLDLVRTSVMVISLSSAERLFKQFSVPLEIISLPSSPRKNEYSHSKHVLNFLSLVFITFNATEMTHWNYIMTRVIHAFLNSAFYVILNFVRVTCFFWVALSLKDETKIHNRVRTWTTPVITWWIKPSLSGSTGPEVPDGFGGERSMLSPVKSLQLFPVQRYSFPIWTDSGAAPEKRFVFYYRGSWSPLLLQFRLTLYIKLDSFPFSSSCSTSTTVVHSFPGHSKTRPEYGFDQQPQFPGRASPSTSSSKHAKNSLGSFPYIMVR